MVVKNKQEFLARCREEKKPMTNKQVTLQHSCQDCLKGRECWYQEHGSDCITDGTCSMRCKSCQGRVWFAGEWNENTPEDFECPYCGAACESPYKEKK